MLETANKTDNDWEIIVEAIEGCLAAVLWLLRPGIQSRHKQILEIEVSNPSFASGELMLAVVAGYISGCILMNVFQRPGLTCPQG